MAWGRVLVYKSEILDDKRVKRIRVSLPSANEQLPVAQWPNDLQQSVCCDLGEEVGWSMPML